MTNNISSIVIGLVALCTEVNFLSSGKSVVQFIYICMYAYICIYMYVCIYVCIYIYIYIYIYITVVVFFRCLVR